MKKTNYSIKKIFKKGIATLLTASMVVTAVQAPAFADNVDEEVTESTASVSGLVRKKITLELVSDELKEAALTAIRENRLFDAQDYLAATGDNQKALREYEAFFNENPGLYVVDAPESVVDTLSGEDAELRIFVQKDAKMAKVDLTASPSEITREDSTESKNVEFRYGTDKDIILYEPASNVDTLVNGGEDAVYIEPEQEIGDNSDYELTGNEKITFMFVNSSDGTVRFTLKVDGVTYDKVEVGGREAALKKIVAEAGTKKSTEETTAAETTVAETTEAVTAVTEEATVADETTAAEVQEVETEAPAEETTAEGTEIANADADNVSAETEETTAAVEERAAETEAPAADTDAEVKEEAPAEVTEEPETEATIPEKIAEAISEAFGGASDAVLGRMTVYADTIVGEGVQFEVEENAPAAEDSEEEEDKDTNEVVAEAVEAAAGEDTATEAEEVSEETTAAVEAAAADNTALAADTTALQIEVSEGLSEDEAENQVEETVAQEVTVVETEPETVAETEAPKETIAKDDETKAAKVATASEIAEYDDFALELIAEVKEEVLQDKAAAKENIKVARIAQYTINELGKIHYETEVDGFNVEVFAAKNAFGDITPTLEAKKLAKPEEAEASEDKLSDDQVAELKANNIYDNSQSLDIHFVDGFGKEVEPSETVKVRITLSDENLLKTIDASSLEVHHLKETDDTLKTEKVAETEDVKLLDKNDEQISDSDLEANAEAIAAGEEAEVEVVSAVAEFEVEDFSVFAIVWREGVDLLVSNIRTFYVDENGNNILDTTAGDKVNFGETGITLANIHGEAEIEFKDVQGGVTNYKYKEARLGSVDGQIITSMVPSGLTVPDDVTYDRKENFYISYYNGNQLVARNTFNAFPYSYDENGAYDEDGNELYHEVEAGQDYNYYFFENGEYHYIAKLLNEDESGNRYVVINGYVYDDTGKRCGYVSQNAENTIYFVYERVNTQSGGDPFKPDLGKPATSKTLHDNEDGTYTLTLSVTGKSEAKQKNVGANVLVVLDLSNSMTESAVEGGDDKIISPNGSYRKVGNGYEKLYYRDNLQRWQEAYDGYNGVVYKSKKTSDRWNGDRYAVNTRLAVAKSAIKSLAEKLLVSNEDSVELGLVTFDDLTKVYTSTNNLEEYEAIIDSLSVNSATGGTNWEGALLEANGYSFGVDDKDPVYVIFVSDGSPTYRVSKNGHELNKSETVTVNGQSITVSYRGGDYKYHINGVDEKDTYHYDKKRLTSLNIYGDGNTDAWGWNKEAAVFASTALIGANKNLYAVNAFREKKDEDAKKTMKALLGSNTDNYYDAYDPTDLKTAFDEIVKKISYDLSYTNVEITDGITSHTDTNIKAKTGNVAATGFVYDVFMTDSEGNELSAKKLSEKNNITIEEAKQLMPQELSEKLNMSIEDATVLANKLADEIDAVESNPADLVSDSNNGTRTVDWNVGGTNHKLLKDATYTASFIVWPDQEAYDTFVDHINGKTVSEENQDLIDNGWSTNTVAWLKYSEIDEEVGKPEEKPYVKITNPPSVQLSGTQIDVEKIWEMDDIENQKIHIEKNSIQLSLFKDTDTENAYISNIVVEPSSDGDVKDANGNSLGTTVYNNDNPPKAIGVKWTDGKKITLAPGVLLSLEKGKEYGFREDKNTVVTFGTKKYFKLEDGHKYYFDEQNDSKKFELDKHVYHPMLVDGDLYDVKFDSTDSKIIDSMDPMHEIVTEGDKQVAVSKITAHNTLEYDSLTVNKQFKGNMAELQEAKFELRLYKDASGNEAYYESGKATEIETLNTVTNEDNSKTKLVTVEEDGKIYFTITPDKLGVDKPIEITLPKDVYYEVEEVKPVSTAGYTTYCGTVTDPSTPGCSTNVITETGEKLKLSDVNTIFFTNKKEVKTPTGIGDNAVPFVALALTGLAAMVFLAYDFQKRRLFED